MKRGEGYMTFPFENNTNAAVKKLAAQRLRADRGKNIFVILAVVLTTSLFAALFCSDITGPPTAILNS